MPDITTPIEEIEGLAAGAEKSLYGTFPQSALDPVLERLREVQVGARRGAQSDAHGTAT